MTNVPITSIHGDVRAGDHARIVSDPDAFPQAFEDALNAGDVDGIVALYDDDAVLRTAAGETTTGHDAVRVEMAELIGARAAITNRLRRTLRTGDVALIVVDYELRLVGPNGEPIVIDGTATNVLRYRAGSGWRMTIANPQGVA